jgi:hypothetical protein
MNDFPFMINLNYKMSDFEIKPPSSLYQLKEVACSKYDLKFAEMEYVTEEGDQKPLVTEEDYFEMINYATDNKLDQIEIVIKKNENTSEKRKESLRKKSSMKNEYENVDRKGKSKLPKIKDENEDEDEKEGGNGGSDDEEVGMQCDYDYFGDTRNRKGMIGDETYSKHNKGFKEDKRIYYIKEKKKRQREEDLKNNQNDEDEEEIVERNRKRIKKETNKDDKNFENNTSEVGQKSNKKKKKPKKDRVRF